MSVCKQINVDDFCVVICILYQSDIILEKKGGKADEENCFRSSHRRSMGSNITEAGDMGCTVP